MKRLFLIICFLTVTGLTNDSIAYGQTIGEFAHRLLIPDSLFSSTVRINQRGGASIAVASYDNTPRPERVLGYRIRIFFDNSQNARDKGLGVQADFRRQFPGIPTYFSYASPSYIVTVGNCATMDEALLLWNRVRRRFTTAFLVRTEIPITEFLRTGDSIPQSEDEYSDDEVDETDQIDERGSIPTM